MCIYRKAWKKVGFDAINIRFGENSPNVENKSVNLHVMILYTKKFIFICLKQNNIPNFVEILRHLSFKQNLQICMFKNFNLGNLKNAGGPMEQFFCL